MRAATRWATLPLHVTNQPIDRPTHPDPNSQPLTTNRRGRLSPLPALGDHPPQLLHLAPLAGAGQGEAHPGRDPGGGQAPARQGPCDWGWGFVGCYGGGVVLKKIFLVPLY